MIDPRLPRITLDGIELHAIDEATCVAHVMRELDEGRGGFVVTPNLDHLARAARDAEFKRLLGAADVAVADGMPLVWASKVQGTPLPQRVAGSSMVWSLAEAAVRHGRSVFLLGGDLGAAEAAAAVLTQRYPGLRIAGTHYPPPGFERNAEQMQQVRDAILAARPDLVYVGLGSPKQEKLIEQLRGLRPGAWWLGVGISISFIAGHVKRAPKFMQQMGLEWFHRMCHDPRRLVKRYFIDDLPYLFRLLWSVRRGRRTVPDPHTDVGGKDGSVSSNR